MTVSLAFYKGTSEHKGFARLSDWLTRVITRGDYSHCELAIPLPTGEYACYSSSVRDGGVRKKIMPLPENNWDLVPVRLTPDRVEKFFQLHEGKDYDWLGAIGFVIFNRGRGEKFFCSEFCAACLKMEDAWRYSPNMLSAIASSTNRLAPA